MRVLRWRGTSAVLLLSGIIAGMLRGDPGDDEPADRLVPLVKKLGAPNFAEREGASQQIVQIGEEALPALRKAAEEGDNLEARWRARGLLRTIILGFRNSRSTGLEMALIEPGSFEMGSPEGEAGRRPDEAPHKVRITRPFLLGVYEVTQDEYRKVMKSNPGWFATTGEGKDKIPEKDTGRFPVECVTWFDAVAFCNALSALDGYKPYYELSNVGRDGGSIQSARVTVLGGNGYRLPTEAEWEYACRAWTTSPHHYGQGANGHKSNVKGVTYTGYGGNVQGPNLQRTRKVGSYAPNAWGLYDMHGNVAEWCWDWYGKDYYAASPADDPSGPGAGQHRVLRGGSWLFSEASARSAARFWDTPDTRKYYGGFRVARTP